MNLPTNELAVFVDVDAVPVHAGVAYFTHGRGQVTTTFVYDPAYLADPRGVELEPALPLQSHQVLLGETLWCRNVTRVG
ncbi:MAG TPA: hypothetical protein VFJ19_20730 [Nocardioidaceae bacterium]|nr:hypothetical protein [Nocardioidaceae bacterium]